MHVIYNISTSGENKTETGSGGGGFNTGGYHHQYSDHGGSFNWLPWR